MPEINLEMQAAFLKQVDEALAEAMGRFDDQKPADIDQLEKMKSEVEKARSAVQQRLDGPLSEKPGLKSIHAVA